MRTVVCPREAVHQGPLIIVNREHPLQDCSGLQLVSVDARFRSILLERRAAQLLQSCIHAVRGSREIVPVSGWRSRQEQQAIWDDTLKKHGLKFTEDYVALPGCSEHQTGLAIDLGRDAKYIDFIRPAFPYDGVCGAFRKLAVQYGFLQRYERGKEAITKVAFEPWHFRYVGTPHAQLMQDHGLCLEEYPAFLQEKPRYCSLSGGRMAEVFYVPSTAEQTPIELPDGLVQISGDNIAGFIVTVWGRIS